MFSLNKWTLERVNDEGLIVTMTTDGGFAVSFSAPLETCKAFGFALRHEGQATNEQPDSADLSNPVTLN